MQQYPPENLLVIDIETVSAFPEYELMDEGWKKCWNRKMMRFVSDDISAANLYPNQAGVMAEFAKIICISCGMFEKDQYRSLYIKSFAGTDEKILLTEFLLFIKQMENRNIRFCFAGHNIKEFDIPFICRRLIVNQFLIPRSLDFQNMKPWETNIVDTFQYWRFGDYKHFTSLELLTKLLDIPSPKEDIDGSMIHQLYWHQQNITKEEIINRIMNYCENDIVATANIILRFKGLPLLIPTDIKQLSQKTNPLPQAG